MKTMPVNLKVDPFSLREKDRMRGIFCDINVLSPSPPSGRRSIVRARSAERGILVTMFILLAALKKLFLRSPVSRGGGIFRDSPALTPWSSGRECRIAGVSLIELVVVITITGIIAVVLGTFIVRPIQGYQAQVRRAELVDAAEMALRRTARDIRQALPNSVRIVDSLGNVNNVTCNVAGVTCTIEMLNTVDGARYRDGPGNIGHNHGPTQFRLSFNGADADGFNIVGRLENFQPTLPCTVDCSQYRLAVYNQGAVPAVACSGTGADAYSDAGCGAGSRVVLTNPSVVAFTISDDGGGDELHIAPSGGSFNFRWASPNQRVFIVDTPVSYVCTAGANGNITRYSNYAITAAQQVTPAGATSIALLSKPISTCRFTYSAGTNQRAGLVTLDVTVSDAESGEQVRLLQQVHVDNAP
jgi:MSHA biogenesis protein MshO